eukprot:g8220.t1
MTEFDLTKRAKKLQEEATQRLSKLKSRGVKNPLKKLPGYGTQWFYRKRKNPPFFSPDSNEDKPSIELDSEKVTRFIKELSPVWKTPKEDDGLVEVIQGPGFEFPTEKETAKCNKHWSKKFKNWQPELKTSNQQPSTKPFSIRFKAPLPSNEVEIEGRRFRLIENKDDEIDEELIKTTHCICKQPVTVTDPKFYAELVTEYGNAHFIRVVTPSEKLDLSLTDPETHVTAVYAPLPLASKILTAVKKKFHAEGKGALADGLRVELKKIEAQEDDDDDGDEVQYPPPAPATGSVKKSSDSAVHNTTPLAEGDEASVFM